MMPLVVLQIGSRLYCTLFFLVLHCGLRHRRWEVGGGRQTVEARVNYPLIPQVSYAVMQKYSSICHFVLLLLEIQRALRLVTMTPSWADGLHLQCVLYVDKHCTCIIVDLSA
ncbi:unnamed protein product, partial [Discosporangium mesarthrocarpum]